jgi:MoxR-like ATPase
VTITSNRTREVHDALKRRCLYFWIDYPSFEKEFDIVRTRLPDAPDRLARQVTSFIQDVRRADLYKLPGVAETLDWTEALIALDKNALDESVVEETLGVILKYQDDVEKISGENARAILERVQAAG